MATDLTFVERLRLSHLDLEALDALVCNQLSAASLGYGSAEWTFSPESQWDVDYLEDHWVAEVRSLAPADAPPLLGVVGRWPCGHRREPWTSYLAVFEREDWLQVGDALQAWLQVWLRRGLRAEAVVWSHPDPASAERALSLRLEWLSSTNV